MRLVGSSLLIETLLEIAQLRLAFITQLELGGGHLDRVFQLTLDGFQFLIGVWWVETWRLVIVF